METFTTPSIFPNRIKVRDDFRRDGLAASFLVGKELFEIYLNAYPPGTRFNIGYPSICRQEYKTCKRILELSDKNDKELCLVGHAREFDLKTMARLLNGRKNVSANIWIPSSVEAAKNILGLTCESVLSLARNAIKYWKSNSSLPLDIALTDVTCPRNNAGQIVDWYNALRSFGYRSVILCDTKGIGREDSLRRIFERIGEFEWHPHDDSNKALNTAAVSAEYGVTYVGTSHLRYSERMNMLDPTQLIPTKLNLNYLDKFNSAFRNLIGDPIEVRQDLFNLDTAITGTHYKLWNSSHKRILFGVTSDCNIVSIIAGRTVSPHELSALKDEYLYRQKVLYISKEQFSDILVVR